MEYTIQYTIATERIDGEWYYCINPRNAVGTDDLWYGVFSTREQAIADAVTRLEGMRAHVLHNLTHPLDKP